MSATYEMKHAKESARVKRMLEEVYARAEALMHEGIDDTGKALNTAESLVEYATTFAVSLACLHGYTQAKAALEEVTP